MNQAADGGRKGLWLFALAGAAVGLYWAIKQERAKARQRSRQRLAASLPERRVGQRFIVITGSEDGLNDDIANRLLGTDFFTCTSAPNDTAQYRDAWWVRVLPSAATHRALQREVAEQLGPEDCLLAVVPRWGGAGDEEALLAALGDLRPTVTRLLYLPSPDTGAPADVDLPPADVISADPDGPEFDRLMRRLNDLT
jgi:hypothetical protein